MKIIAAGLSAKRPSIGNHDRRADGWFAVPHAVNVWQGTVAGVILLGIAQALLAAMNGGLGRPAITAMYLQNEMPA